MSETSVKEAPKDRLKEITDSIERGIQELFDSDRYKQYLQTMSHFHNYSLNNVMLISMQCPDATHVAGYSKWQTAFSRHVKKGEKGIKIIAPAPYKKKVEELLMNPETQQPMCGPDGALLKQEVEVVIPRFRTVTVFDVSQTDGKPLPALAQNLTASVQNYAIMMEALHRTSPAPISIEPILDGSDGFYSHASRSITVKEGMSESQTISTTIHEIAHAKLHSRPNVQPDHEITVQEELSTDKDQRTKEVEAESIAYAVCQYYGIETADNSFGYIAAWSKSRELAELRSSLETINKTAAALIDTIDRHLAEISAERGLTVNTDQRTEALYLVNHSFYVHLQATDAGWDYTVYDRPSLRQVDGGVLDEAAQDITEACDQVLKLQGISGKTVEPIDLDMLNTLQDAQRIKPQEATLAAMEQNFLDLRSDSYAIYQLRDDGSCDELHWLAMADLQKLGQSIEKQHYELTYADELNQYSGKSVHEVLNDLFYRFNQEHPADFHGHSLSVSDMVALRHEGKLQCFYVDRYGFAEVPDFYSRCVSSDREEKRRPAVDRPSLRKQLEQHQRKNPVHRGKVKKHSAPEL